MGGTNGKGSTVASLDALLSTAGLRVGRYTSPHLVDFRERIVAGGEPISESRVVDFVDYWLPTIERTGATFFEATTCLALSYFAEQEVDVAIIEVGLGGRLDATNVIHPLVSAVTSIGLDHTEYLGPTLEQIAFEKAGIFKPGVPAVIGERNPHIAAELTALAEAAGARIVIDVWQERRPMLLDVGAWGTTFKMSGPNAPVLHTPLVGEHQVGNTAVALTMLEVAGQPYARAVELAPEALRHVELPGRFQRQGALIFDVSHNLEGVDALCANLMAAPPQRPLVAVVAILRDKPWREMLDRLARHVDGIVLTVPESAPPDRIWSLADAQSFAASLSVPVQSEASFDAALDQAISAAATTLVTGSFFTVGDAMARLQASPAAR